MERPAISKGRRDPPNGSAGSGEQTSFKRLKRGHSQASNTEKAFAVRRAPLSSLTGPLLLVSLGCWLAAAALAEAQLYPGETQPPLPARGGYRFGGTGAGYPLQTTQLPPLLARGPARTQQPLQMVSMTSQGSAALVPQSWARGLVAEPVTRLAGAGETALELSAGAGSGGPTPTPELSPLPLLVRRNSSQQRSMGRGQAPAALPGGPHLPPFKTVRHIVGADGGAAAGTSGGTQNGSTGSASLASSVASGEDACADRLCYGLPMGCLGAGTGSGPTSGAAGAGARFAEAIMSPAGARSHLCTVLVTSKRFIDPNRPVSRDILFELIALPQPEISNWAAVGFSENGRMQGLVSECVQTRDSKTQLQVVRLRHSYNTPGSYDNLPVTVLSGIRNLGVSVENGYYQCRWIVESAVEFTFEARNGSIINRREDLGYKNYHILLASGRYDELTGRKYRSLDLALIEPFPRGTAGSWSLPD